MTESTVSSTADAESQSTSARRRSDRKVHQSAIDWWVAVLLGAPIVGAVAVAAYLIALGRPGDASVMFLTAAGILVVTAIFTVPCRYTLLTDTLSIRCGVVCYQVPYETIREVRKSATLRSGPALSLRRVVVKTDRREHILSPVDRERFIEQLNSRIAS
ncbi:PH domain-containing protein [Rhodopirellula sallentina]|uniref:Signal peptide protein n=1 Tax=Rhodopirellula sallentina SM41 TaxID=1263870 RepID=M5U187_9BACT|nr:PH domain-containing protein [Rhodopirellula sallentina]EMI55049.1 signal peptide protein [Rhodopirellula sallentina SM41]